MRVTSFAPLLAALSSVAFAAHMHHPNRMVRKRITAPFVQGLHLTSTDSNGNDALSPVSNALQTETFSNEFDKGHLTGPGSITQDYQITGAHSILDSGELPVGSDDPGNSFGQSLGGAAAVSSVTGNLGSGGIVGVRRGIFGVDPSEVVADAPDVTTEESQAEGGIPISVGPAGVTGFGGRLRGMKVRRMDFDSVVPATQDVDLTFVQSEAAADVNTFTAHGSPYQAAKWRGDALGLGDLGLRK